MPTVTRTPRRETTREPLGRQSTTRRSSVAMGLTFPHARAPAAYGRPSRSNLTAGRRTLVDLAAEGLVPAAFGESDDPDRLVPIVTAPEKFVIAVAGDPNRTNAYVLSSDGPHGDWTSKPIDRSFSTDLVCSVSRPSDAAR